jgi:hypothetical protein
MPADKTIDTVLMIIAGGALTLGLGSVLFGWLVGQWDRLMSRGAATGATQNGNQEPANRAFSSGETNYEPTETPQRIAEIRAESFTLGETQALARLVAEKKIGLTDAVRIGADAKSGEKYQKRSRDIKAAVERLREPEFPALAAQQRPSILEKM